MTGDSRPIVEHRLNIREGCLPIRQKKKGKAPERNKAICEEVKKLVDADIMKEVRYHSWLSNLVMAEDDEEKIAFITSQRIFWYSKMSFELKNAGATYQRLVDKAFQKQIGWNLEVYVDDLVIKSHTEKEVIRDIEETFKTLREINMKLNPKKCAFGMREGTFLGYKVDADGLRVCPDKIEAVLNLPSSKAGLIITNLKEMEFTYALRFMFNATNNEAEYEALIAGLWIANKRARHDQIFGQGKNQANAFKEFSIKQVPRGENKKADALSKIESNSFAYLSKQVLVEELKEKSIDEKEVLTIVEEEGRTWMTPIYEYLTEEILPEEKRKARAIRHKAGRYVVANEILYKKSFLGPWLRCVGPLQANYVLREIHEGSCSMHFSPRSMVAKALRSGYYSPTMHTGARNLIRECSSCQIHRPVPRNPQQKLTPITFPWLFYK
uniref:Reverse transcriptase domain-containing protein n=1 Tax=Tanacetum cinerariifolium TaxID=118510 RepID=A0A699HA65_TANCI|nr:reverse transcriptase domain-containing protein [Tanacetum cinerariifolium]